MNQMASTAPIIIPESFNIATLLPDAAILPSRPADPFKDVLIEENVSDWFKYQHRSLLRIWYQERTNSIIDHILRSCVVIYINCDASQCSDLSGQLG